MKNRFNQFFKTIGIGLLVSVIGLIINHTSTGLFLEEEYGLNWLFQLRGKVEAPSKVVIVSIDRASSINLDLSDQPEKWPRSLHAQLITQLKAKGARLIVFNIIFDENREAADSAMADAMQQANNVILVDYLKHRTHIVRDSRGSILQRIHQVELIHPVPDLYQSAIASAPFLLPKGEMVVKRFLPFGSIESLATLPVIVLQTTVILLCDDDFLKIIKTVLPQLSQPLSELYQDIFSNQNIHRLVYALQASIEQDEQLSGKLVEALYASHMPDYQRQLIETLFNLYDKKQSRYLNHYGPPKTIVTVPYHIVINNNSPTAIDFNNTIVFIGFSEDLQPERYQGFFTFFTQDKRENISSVELAATAFSNLLYNKVIKPLSLFEKALIVVFWGLIIGFVCRIFPIVTAIITLTVLSGCYLSFSFWQFITMNTWLPLVTPLALQVPFAILLGIFYHYVSNIREKSNIQTNFARYLPKEVVDAASKQNTSNYTIGNWQSTHGVCLATDAGQYTPLAESLDPIVLGKLINDYYATIFAPVSQYNGYISDVIGDAMLAIWSSMRSDPEVRINACHAALGIRQASIDFSKANEHKLFTRIGLHYGSMLIGNVGTTKRMEYRAVGDTINTASRIEGLNKILGTHVLASKEVIEFLDNLYTRELGTFLLAGKKQPLIIYEILGRKNDLDKPMQILCSQFSKALDLFKTNQLKDALEIFNHLAHSYPNDGPCAFYQKKTIEYQLTQPDDSWNGVIRIDKPG